MPAALVHQCNAYNLAQWLFALDEKRSTVCGPHRPSKRPKNPLDIEFSGMGIFEMSSIREVILLPRHPLHRGGDAVPQAEPKELPRQLVDDEFGAQDPQKVLRIHL